MPPNHHLTVNLNVSHCQLVELELIQINTAQDQGYLM